MTEKLSQILGKEERRLKVGKSFEKRNTGTEYNSIRYDFKPVSIDEEKQGTLEVGENNSVAVSLPHVDGAGKTNYRGHMSQSNPKECVLIIDHDTGEITIERLVKQVMLKKTRPEKNDSATKMLEESLNPYEVKLVPDKPGGPGGSSAGARESSVGSTNRKPLQSDYQPSQQPARSSPVPTIHKSKPQSKAHGGSGSVNSIPKSKPPPKAPSGGVVANSMPSSNMESSSSGSDSSSSSSDDSESDNEDISRAAAAIEAGDGGMPSFGGGGGGGVLPTARPQQPRGGGGVLPTSRPTPPQQAPAQLRGEGVLPTSARPPSAHHKSKKSGMPSMVPTAAVPCLNDDLMLSSDDSDSD